MYEAAKDDPRLFLSQFKKGIIIDEVQRLPSLFSYIQTISDERNKPGEFILTGSENFCCLKKNRVWPVGYCIASAAFEH